MCDCVHLCMWCGGRLSWIHLCAILCAHGQTHELRDKGYRRSRAKPRRQVTPLPPPASSSSPDGERRAYEFTALGGQASSQSDAAGAARSRVGPFPAGRCEKKGWEGVGKGGPGGLFLLHGPQAQCRLLSMCMVCTRKKHGELGKRCRFLTA